MNYEEEVFDNYKELAAKYPQAAAALLKEVGEDDWQDSWLYYYPTVKDFTLHELDNGWYFNYKLKYDVDFDGALNLLDFIDHKALGKALTEGSFASFVPKKLRHGTSITASSKQTIAKS